MNLYSLNTGFFKLDGGAMFGVVPKPIWNKLNPADENNRCTWALRCLLIEDGKQLILIDNGIGNKQDDKFFGHYDIHGGEALMPAMARLGFHPRDVTDVLLTHLHFDHCGGSIIRDGDRLVPAFPNASYWSNEAHWQWAQFPNDREKASFLKENIMPIQASGQLKWIPEEDNCPWQESIQIRFVYGHTEAMMLPKIRYKDKTLVFVADLLPSIAHIPIPFIMAYDTRPLRTLLEKKKFLEEAEKNNWVLFFEHDPGVECCTLQNTEKGIRAKATFSLSEL